MAESLFWFPGYDLGYINQVVQKNVSCLLTRIMNFTGMCLCLRNALISGKPCWSWETPALADPPSTTLFRLSTGRKSFPPSGFPSHLLWTVTLTWSSPSRLHSCLKTEITAVSPWIFPSCRERVVGSLWFIVVVFLFSFLSVGVRVRRYLAQRKARGGGEVGARVWSWSRLGLCRWEKNSLCSWVSPFSTSAPFGEKGRRKKTQKSLVSLKLTYFRSILFEFSGGNAAKQSICPQNRQPKQRNAPLTKMTGAMVSSADETGDHVILPPV